MFGAATEKANLPRFSLFLRTEKNKVNEQDPINLIVLFILVRIA